jgi:hypothetical protein
MGRVEIGRQPGQGSVSPDRSAQEGLAQIAEVVAKLRPMHKSYLREFERLVRAAEDENQKNW